jgi:serine/threonine kinase 16
VYILLPYYRRGNLQDVINANLVNGTKYPERRLMVMVLGLCKALKALHQYKVGRNGGMRSAKGVRAQAARADREAAEEVQEEEGHSKSRRQRRDDRKGSMDTEQEPLMDDEVTASQDGVAPGQIRAYAHR